MVFEDIFLGLTVAVRFLRNQCFKNRDFSYSFFQPIVHNTVVVTKQIYFLTTFFISWVHISDNIAGVVGGQQYY